MDIQFVSVREVAKIHYLLVDEFVTDINPIDPPGIKSQSLLESAVSRQTTCLHGEMKYPDIFQNAATLLYGLICDHPFHNGNKRTALVSMLVHLDKNRYSLINVKDKDIYNLVINVAKHDLPVNESCEKYNTDKEVRFIGEWIQNNAISLTRGDREITYRDLQRILEHFHFELGKPDRNSISIGKVTIVTDRHGNKVRKVNNIGSIGYPGENRFISIGTIKRVRTMCNLTLEDGVTSDMFYYKGMIIDTFVNKYRNILKKLANK